MKGWRNVIRCKSVWCLNTVRGSEAENLNSPIILPLSSLCGGIRRSIICLAHVVGMMLLLVYDQFGGELVTEEPFQDITVRRLQGG